MTKWEKMEIDKRSSVRAFLRENNMSAWDLAKITKQLCSCGTCHFFCQHYTKNGEALDWGHCCKGNIQHSKKISTASCGFWVDCEEDIEDDGGNNIGNGEG